MIIYTLKFTVKYFGENIYLNKKHRQKSVCIGSYKNMQEVFKRLR